jgi:hypothetical protein
MKKASTLLVPVILLGSWAAVVQSCASGETDPALVGSGGSSGDNGSGGATSGSGGTVGSGGSSSTSSGGTTASSGGTSGSASGGHVGSGGTTGTASGGAKGSGGVKGSGGTTGTASGGTVGSGGTTTTGTGGTTVTPTGGMPGSMTCNKQDSTMTVSNGMATNGTWSGYAYTYIGSTPATIAPVCGTTGTCFMTAAKQLCVSGTVGPDPSFGASAGFGWDIGAMATSGAAGKGGSTTGTKPAIAPGGTGLSYNVPGITTSMRIQVEDAAGNDYCATVPVANMGTIPWGMFTQKCYASPPGTAYTATTKITSVQIVVPTTSGSMAMSFCFCVVSMGSGA